MLTTLLAWVIISLLTGVLGLAGLRLYQRWFKLPTAAVVDYSPPLVAIFGLIILTIVLSYLSLVWPISTLVHSIIAVIALGYVVMDREFVYHYLKHYYQRSRILPKYYVAALLIISAIIAGQASIGPEHADECGYHTQTILWLQQYGTVPGLGNIHDRFAFNSSWFLPNAFWQLNWHNMEIVTAINGVLLLLVIYWFANSVIKLCRKTVTSQHVFFVICLILMPVADFLLPPSISSTNTEVAVFLFFFVTIGLMLQYRDLTDLASRRLLAVVVTILAVVTLTIKLNAIPLLILPLYFIGEAMWQRRHRDAVVIIGAGLASLLPWIGHNIILSGYLIYPFPSQWLDWFPVDWKIPQAAVQHTSDVTKAWARLPLHSPPEVLQGGFRLWGKNWWQTMNTISFIHYLFLPGLILWVPLALYWHKIVLNFIKRYAISVITVIASIGFWFITAPDIRFGLGYFVALIALLYVPIFQAIMQSRLQRRSWEGLEVGLMIGLVMICLTKTDALAIRRALLITLSNPAPTSDRWTTQDLDGQTFAISENCCLPRICIPGIPPKVELRGNNLQDGFRITQ